MDVVLRLLSLASVFVGFGEGVCNVKSAHVDHHCTFCLSCAYDRRDLCDVKKAVRECRSELNVVEHRMWSRWQGRLRGRLPKVLRFWIVVIKASVR